MTLLKRLALAGLLVVGVVTATNTSSSEKKGLRSLLPAPRDVYSIELTNGLSGPADATVTFITSTKGKLVSSATLDAGEKWTFGPFDYTVDTAKFRYVASSVQVSAGENSGEPASLSAPFDSVTGVTPLLRVDIKPAANSSHKVGSLQAHVGA